MPHPFAKTTEAPPFAKTTEAPRKEGEERSNKSIFVFVQPKQLIFYYSLRHQNYRLFSAICQVMNYQPGASLELF